MLASSTIATPGGDALLADLAPGPAGDALVLWTEPLPSALGPPDVTRQAIFASRSQDAYPGRTRVRRTGAGRAAGAGERCERRARPGSDRAVAVWQGEDGAIEYSIGDAPPGR